MLVLHYISTTLAIFAGLIGLWAAYIWFKASKVSFIDDVAEKSGDIEFANRLRVLHITVAAGENGRLNKVAALWTAASVILSAASNLIGTLY